MNNEQTHLCNLISFVAMVVADIWNDKCDINQALHSLEDEQLYGKLPEDLKKHVISVILANYNAYDQNTNPII